MTVIEPLSRGLQHSALNRSYLELLQQGFNRIKIISSECHWQELNRDQDEISSQVVFEPEKFELGNSLQKIVANISKFRRILKSENGATERVLLLSCNNSILLAYKLASFSLPTTHAVILHGFVSGLGASKTKFEYHKTRTVLSLFNGNKKYEYIVLSGHANNRIADSLPKIRPFLKTLYPPVKPNLIKDDSLVGNEESGTPKRIEIGSAGIYSNEKGSGIFFKVASESKENIALNFKYIGAFPKSSTGAGVAIPNNVLLISRPSDIEYQKEFLKLSALFLSYQSRIYDFGLSGIFIDAVRYRKPIIGIKNYMLEYYFNKYGPLGWLFETEDQATNFIKNMTVEQFEREIPEFEKNLSKIAQEFSCQNLVNAYVQLLRS
jgi:hypothetical protein